MPYIGQDLQVAYPTYLNIDDISGSFNGSTTSFALLVSGSAPVPLPLNSQQCLISVGGVIQRPDDSGTEGFRLSGGNIIFSSAPNTGEDFFGVILAGADYVNVGANFPDGSQAAPSITFEQDNDTGFYRSGSGLVSVSSNNTKVFTFPSTAGSNGQYLQTDGAGTATWASVASDKISEGNTEAEVVDTGSDGHFKVTTEGTERMRVDPSGRLLVGTSTTSTVLTSVFQGNSSGATNPAIAYLCKGAAASSGDVLGILRFGDSSQNTYAQVYAEADAATGSGDYPGRLVFSTTADGASSPTERMRITRNGGVLVGGAIPQTYGASLGYMMAIRALTGTQTYVSIAAPGQAADSQGMVVGLDSVDGYVVVRDNKNLRFSTNDTIRMTIGNGGGVVIGGSLSKGSGSFRIDHPLPEKKNTHQLVHSFIEGPQADLIYRGHVCLINGKAQVNIDEAAQMTEGTFEALCRDVCCFTTNESDWTPVRGSVTGNILTIEAQDPASCADVCWLVIGERKDQHMFDTDWTDENGKVITEPLKETPISEAV